MGFWDDYLRDPPLEVNFSADWRHNLEDSPLCGVGGGMKGDLK